MQYSIGDIRRLLFISVLAIFFHIIVLVHLNFLLFLVFNVAFDNEEKNMIYQFSLYFLTLNYFCA